MIDLLLLIAQTNAKFEAAQTRFYFSIAIAVAGAVLVAVGVIAAMRKKK